MNRGFSQAVHGCAGCLRRGRRFGIVNRGGRRFGRQGDTALQPGGSEFVDEGFDLVELPSMHLQERNPSGQKDVVHQQSVTRLAAVSTAVVLIELDGQHG